ncbi:hypothetical protein O6H91_01G083300 [Diphasiastrum complanatum]|uniref:Uncharacterized protein n=1 Tax=Diphasiastrum complanatum TaxID=34168 RepID=A0ACC2ESJ2_DIPCM|nr:hypothetical protein O6H91_01G083300 [Diphasiastrum complanatum]
MAAPLLASNEIQYETVLEAKFYHNGRSDHDQIYPTAPANTDKAIEGALSRDVVIDSSTGIWVRLYVPERVLSASEGEAVRLPIILHYHGGGFMLFSAASAYTHEYCCQIAARLGLMVVSVEYRLAPEHKLPAAFEDGLSALKWLQAQGSDEQDSGPKDPWLSAHGDFAKCFIMGHSAGATIVHHTVLNAASDGFDPLKIRGLILGGPFFGGIERTSSEIKYGETDFLTLQLADAFWGASLLDGADRSHPYAPSTPPRCRPY